MRLLVLAPVFIGAMVGASDVGKTNKGRAMQVLDGIDELVKARNESVDALGRVIRRPLTGTGSTKNFDIVTSKFPDDSPFVGIEVRKPREAPLNRGLMIVDIRASSCIPSEAVVQRYGQVDDLVTPRPPIQAPQRGPADRPTDYVYNRPWGKLSFGFVNTPGGECLSRAVIDWTL